MDICSSNVTCSFKKCGSHGVVRKSWCEVNPAGEALAQLDSFMCLGSKTFLSSSYEERCHRSVEQQILLQSKLEYNVCQLPSTSVRVSVGSWLLSPLTICIQLTCSPFRRKWHLHYFIQLFHPHINTSKLKQWLILLFSMMIRKATRCKFLLT